VESISRHIACLCPLNGRRHVQPNRHTLKGRSKWCKCGEAHASELGVTPKRESLRRQTCALSHGRKRRIVLRVMGAKSPHVQYEFWPLRVPRRRIEARCRPTRALTMQSTRADINMMLSGLGSASWRVELEHYAIRRDHALTGKLPKYTRTGLRVPEDGTVQPCALRVNSCLQPLAEDKRHWGGGKGEWKWSSRANRTTASSTAPRAWEGPAAPARCRTLEPHPCDVVGPGLLGNAAVSKVRLWRAFWAAVGVSNAEIQVGLSLPYQ
jgi:hypothetical protein